MKIFVLDTSVLIHDPSAFSSFENSHIAIPIFVIMELDELKERKDFHVSSAARMASRSIIDLMNYGSLHDPEGITNPKNNSTYYIISSEKGEGLDALQESKNNRKMDLLILSSALALQLRFSNHRVVLISRDVNLRILANSEGLEAEDYTKDKVDIGSLYRGWTSLKEGDFDPLVLSNLYTPEAEIHTDENIYLRDEFIENEFFVFGHEDGTTTKQHLAINKGGHLSYVPKNFKGVRISPRNLEQRMALSVLMDPEISLVTLIGRAGTGKTFLALAAALAQIEHGPYEKILLTKPNVAMGQDIGYLPGSENDKMKPWMQSFFDNLDQLFPSEKEDLFHKTPEKPWEHLFFSGGMEIQPVYSVRGRSICNAFVIIDEAQNLTPHETKTLITRAAEGTKVILCGDPYQVDRRFMDQHSTGITYVTKRMMGACEFGTVYFKTGVRSTLAELAATRL